MSASPLIGISTGARKSPDSSAPLLVVRSSYPYAVLKAGGAPVVIPLGADTEHLRDMYDHLDGILLSGGGDVEPAHYQAEKISPYTTKLDPNRDAVELQLARWAVEDDKPLLAICRGVQVLNVALGGTLVQDIRDEIKGALRHDAQSEKWFTRLVHDVNVISGSRLAEALGTDDPRISVNSLHHQALADVADGLMVTARAEDDVVEAVEHSQCEFVIGVQWHPEALVDDHPVMLRLFEAFVKAARDTAYSK